MCGGGGSRGDSSDGAGSRAAVLAAGECLGLECSTRCRLRVLLALRCADHLMVSHASDFIHFIPLIPSVFDYMCSMIAMGRWLEYASG